MNLSREKKYSWTFFLLISHLFRILAALWIHTKYRFLLGLHDFSCHCRMHGFWSDSNDDHWLWCRALEWRLLCSFQAHSPSGLKMVLENTWQIFQKSFVNALTQKKNIFRSLSLNFTLFFFSSTGTSKADWVPVLCLLLYVCFSMIGLLTIPWTMTAELFPNEIRGVAHSISYSMANILMFIAIQVYR